MIKNNKPAYDSSVHYTAQLNQATVAWFICAEIKKSFLESNDFEGWSTCA